MNKKTTTETKNISFKIDAKLHKRVKKYCEKNNITIRDFAKMSVNAFPERKLSLSFANKRDEIEPDQSYFSSTPEILDNTRLKNIGWTSKVNLKEGIMRSIRTIEEQNKDILLMEGN